MPAAIPAKSQVIAAARPEQLRSAAKYPAAAGCPIRHARRVRGAHDHYAAFVPYGDARGYRERLATLRAAMTG